MSEMAKNSYSEDFKRRAVDLYESTPGATLQGIANDLGISRGALKTWTRKYGTGQLSVPLSKTETTERPESQSARIVRLESELARSRAEARKLAEKRDILRQAAKYFAGETNW